MSQTNEGGKSILPRGTVVLRSGIWRWELHPAPNGTSVDYRHLRRHRDELHSWVADPATLTQESLTALARDPVTRTWVDVVGLRWELSIEKKRSLQGESDSAWLIFERGTSQWAVSVSSALHLGELTHGELQQLLELA